MSALSMREGNFERYCGFEKNIFPQVIPTMSLPLLAKLTECGDPVAASYNQRYGRFLS